GSPQVSMSADGTRAAVVWDQDSETHARVWNNSALSDSQILANGADSLVVQMAADGTTAHTVWRGTGNETYWSRLTGNIWSAGVSISGPNTEQPDVSVSDSGQAMAAWDADSGLQARFWDGSAWGNVATMGSTSIHQPSVSLTSDGTHAATGWYDSSGANYIVNTALWSDGQWAAPQALSAPGGNATQPVVAVAGTAPVGFAAWRRKDPGFDVVQVSNLLASPSAPLAPVASAGTNRATVSWQPPASSGNSPITGYTVTAAPGGATCASSTTTCDVPGLTDGTSYTFTVTATNAVGVSPPSVASNAVTPLPEKPGKVKKVKVKPTKATKVKVTWKKATRATSYQVKLSKPGGKKFPGAWRSTKKRTMTLKVKTGKKYAVKVRGRNLGGTGPVVKTRFRT
ncbi:MAG: fibronectin type III domain-containing protein, partial [Candidatus Nanopelagicales bacterium]|nr:fibronectin type III domain-containing protein [Candidatus Nanopelagicales bacterium]